MKGAARWMDGVKTGTGVSDGLGGSTAAILERRVEGPSVPASATGLYVFS